MIRLITFTDDNMTISAEQLRQSAMIHGVDEVTVYTPNQLDEFYLLSILTPLIKNSRGYGWWAWKPYIVMDAFRSAKDGDILIYSDAGQQLVASVQPVINAMDEDIMLFSNGWQHSHWCKCEVARAINSNFFPHEDWFTGYDMKQVQASFILFKINETTRKFVQEWYAWSLMPGFIDNTPRGPQFPEFQEHRHDQAILTCLQIKYGYKLHWFPSTTNQHQRTNESYDTTILHHRRRNNEW